ncbi:MAG TPA: AlpA family phage regulatory protein [Xanthobacteraceae bacterium]|nr:AlpA family phage regulatory protein [Xanthobacteraceae bacterium]
MRNLLTKKTVGDRVGLHPESVMRLARAGQFPRPIKLGDGDKSSVRFVETEVDAWIAEKMATRETA